MKKEKKTKIHFILYFHHYAKPTWKDNFIIVKRADIYVKVGVITSISRKELEAKLKISAKMLDEHMLITHSKD